MNKYLQPKRKQTARFSAKRVAWIQNWRFIDIHDTCWRETSETRQLSLRAFEWCWSREPWSYQHQWQRCGKRSPIFSKKKHETQKYCNFCKKDLQVGSTTITETSKSQQKEKDKLPSQTVRKSGTYRHIQNSGTFTWSWNCSIQMVLKLKQEREKKA